VRQFAASVCSVVPDDDSLDHLGFRDHSLFEKDSPVQHAGEFVVGACSDLAEDARGDRSAELGDEIACEAGVVDERADLDVARLSAIREICRAHE
jgi:hypothetical protein